MIYLLILKFYYILVYKNNSVDCMEIYVYNIIKREISVCVFNYTVPLKI